MFDRLKLWKQAGMSASAMVVLAYVQAYGMAPVGVISSACEVSDRSVYEALSKARKAGLLKDLQESSQHDHVQHDHGEKREGCGNPQGAPQEPASLTPEARAVAALVKAGIFPGAAKRLVLEHGLELVERQLAHHAERERLGFAYQRHPAAYLYRAVTKDLPGPWVAPAGLVADQERKAAELRPQPQAVPERVAPEDTWTKASATGWVAKFANSHIPALRDKARGLAERFGLQLPPSSLAASEAGSSSAQAASPLLTATA